MRNLMKTGDKEAIRKTPFRIYKSSTPVYGSYRNASVSLSTSDGKEEEYDQWLYFNGQTGKIESFFCGYRTEYSVYSWGSYEKMNPWLNFEDTLSVSPENKAAAFCELLERLIERQILEWTRLFTRVVDYLMKP